MLQGDAQSLIHLDLKNASLFWLNPPTESIPTLRLGRGDWPDVQSKY